MVETQNEAGTKFQLLGNTDVTIDGMERYLYHFKNLGNNHGFASVRGFIEEYYITEAMVAAPSYNAAIALLTEEHFSDAYSGYDFEVQLCGVDLMYSEGDRIIFYAKHPPYF